MPRSGVGTYTRELVEGLATTEGVDLTLYLNQARGAVAESVTALPGSLVRSRIPSRLAARAWPLIGWPPIERIVGEVDVFHSSDWSQPPSRSVPVVTTIHDLGALRHPEWYDASVVAMHRWKNRNAMTSADAIIAISEFTRREIIALFPEVEPSRLRVVPNGVSADFRKVDEDVALGRARELGLPPRFVLYVGSRERRKNVLGLMEIFARVRSEEPDLDLVIVGMRPDVEGRMIHGVRAWSHEDVQARIAGLGLGGIVHEIGQIPRQDLVAVYGAAELMIYPTLYEGFGLPALEAMACGLPVVSSTGTAVAEVLGEAGRLAPPTEHDAFAQAVLGLLRSEADRSRLRTAGLERARTMSWKRTARETLEVYRTTRSLNM